MDVGKIKETLETPKKGEEKSPKANGTPKRTPKNQG